MRINKPFMLWALLTAGLVLYGYYGDFSEPAKKKPVSDPIIRQDATEKWEAYEAATNIVSTQLVAPSTARFPSYRYDMITTVDYCTWIINSYVDSQNSFGAMIRTQYRAKVMKLDPQGSRWKLLDLKIYK